MYQKRKELNRENNTLDKQIFAENQGVFTDMICYLRGSSLSAYDQERVRRDLTEMVLDAQERGDTLSDVIGGDYKAFCDEIIPVFRINLPAVGQRNMAVSFVWQRLFWGALRFSFRLRS